jgi:hypothetical protein
MSDESTDDTGDAPALDPRIEDLRRRLAEALLEVNHGEYFRSRIHGWVAYRHDTDVVLPVGIAERLISQFSFDRDEGDADEVATLDAFVIAYHAAESCYRLLFALYDGSRTHTASALIAMNELKAGPLFNDRVKALMGLPDETLTTVLDFLFLPPEIKDAWPDGADQIEDVQEYLRLWCRRLGRFLGEWRPAYNAAKHGLAVGARPVQFMFVPTDPPLPPAEMGNGPMLRTVEHEFQKDDAGNVIKVNGKKVLRWYWMYRAVDPEELIAQAIVTADLLDWLRAIARSRHLKENGVRVPIRAEPKPRDLRRPKSALETFQMDLAAFPLSQEQAAEVLSRMDQSDEPERPD